MSIFFRKTEKHKDDCKMRERNGQNNHLFWNITNRFNISQQVLLYPRYPFFTLCWATLFHGYNLIQKTLQYFGFFLHHCRSRFAAGLIFFIVLAPQQGYYFLTKKTNVYDEEESWCFLWFIVPFKCCKFNSWRL